MFLLPACILEWSFAAWGQTCCGFADQNSFHYTNAVSLYITCSWYVLFILAMVIKIELHYVSDENIYDSSSMIWLWCILSCFSMDTITNYTRSLTCTHIQNYYQSCGFFSAGVFPASSQIQNGTHISIYLYTHIYVYTLMYEHIYIYAQMNFPPKINTFVTLSLH